MKTFIVLALAVLVWAGAQGSPVPADTSLAKNAKETMDFIRQEQRTHIADQYAQAHPTFVVPNNTQRESGYGGVKQPQPTSSPKRDWELVHVTTTPQYYPSSRQHYRGHQLPTTLPTYYYGQTTEAYNRYPPRAYGQQQHQHQQTIVTDIQVSRRRRQAERAGAGAGGGIVPDRSEIVIGSNAIRVSQADRNRARARAPTQTPRAPAPAPGAQ